MQVNYTHLYFQNPKKWRQVVRESQVKRPGCFMRTYFKAYLKERERKRGQIPRFMKLKTSTTNM